MSLETLVSDLVRGDILDSLFPDFILSFAFFTSLAYAAVSRRIDHQRPATMLSVAVGLAFSISLVWWEYQHDFSIKDLGPLAVGFALIMLGGVMYQAIRRVGGTFAGAGIALGASLIVGWILGLDEYADPRIFQTIITVALIIGILAFLAHRGHGFGHIGRPRADDTEIRHDMSDLHDDRRVARKLRSRFRHLRREADQLHKRPANSDNIMLQLRRMLPAEGWLTERLARLRARAHVMRKGHIARIAEIQAKIKGLPLQAKRKAAKTLESRYQELQFDVRLERLDATAAACEKRVRNLTQQARVCLATHDHKRLVDVLEDAEKLQKHNARLLKAIERTEKRLIALAQQIGKES